MTSTPKGGHHMNPCHHRSHPPRHNEHSRLRDPDRISAWNVNKPNSDTCCICGHQIIAFAVMEQRPTGPGRTRQNWWYCVPCHDWVHETADIPIDWLGIASSLGDDYVFPEV